MDQRQVFANMQTATNFGSVSDEALGGLVIVSALFTEFALTDVIFAEADKIRAAADIENVTATGLSDVDNSVANVLKQVCCIEKQIVKKIKLGIDLRG